MINLLLNIGISSAVIGFGILGLFRILLVNRSDSSGLNTMVQNEQVQTSLVTADQKNKIDQLVSIFENGIPEIQYGYIENLKDGRGYTAGKIGFISANDEIYRVVDLYTKYKGVNNLRIYLNRLKELADQGSSSIKGLEGFEQAWRLNADDPAFRLAQDELADEIYYEPALAYAKQLGITYPLSIGFVYDTIIQHGDGDDPDGLSALIDRTNSMAGGSPAKGVSEERWLAIFIQERKKTLNFAYDEETREVWAESTGRCDVFTELLQKRNFYLQGPVEANTEEYEIFIP